MIPRPLSFHAAAVFSLCLSAGLLKFSNSAVALMRRPAVRRRLQAELAALPQQLISYEELLAFFIDYGASLADDLQKGGKRTTPADADIWTVAQLAAELLPQLLSDNPRLRCVAADMAKAVAIMAACVSPDSERAAAASTRYRTMLRAALGVAQQQGSDFYMAACGYAVATTMATDIITYGTDSAVQPGTPPPSAVLGWLHEAEAAHRRCRALLPKAWFSGLGVLKAMAATTTPWLQRLRQGDCWRHSTPAVQRELEEALQDFRDSNKGPAPTKLICSGCGTSAPQLRVCGACRKAQYCR